MSRAHRSQFRDRRLWNEFLQLMRHFESILGRLEELCGRERVTEAWLEAFSVVEETIMDVCEIADIDFGPSRYPLLLSR